MNEQALKEKTYKNKDIAIAVLVISLMAACTILYCYFLAHDTVRPGGYNGAEWSWERHEPGPTYGTGLKIVGQALALSMIFIIISVWLFSRSKKAIVLILPMIVFVSYYIGLGVTVERVYDFHNYPITIVNNGLTGYFEDAIKTANPLKIFSGFEGIHESLTGHSRSHPPGGILFFWLILAAVKGSSHLGQAAMWVSHNLFNINHDYLMSIDIILRDKTNYQASIWAGILLPILCIGSVFPLYQIGKVLFSRQVGMTAAFFSLAIPSYILISPQLDQIYPLLAALFIALYLTGVKKNNAPLTVISGLVLLMAYFLSISLALLIPIAFLMTWLIERYGLEEKMIDQDLSVSLKKTFTNKHFWILIGTVLGLSVFLMFFRINIFTITTSLLKFNAGFNENVNGVGRSYSFWLINNLYDYFFFMGIPITILFIASLFMGRNPEAKRGWVLSLLMLSFILLLDVSGINRAEIARLWMFFIPMFIIGAAVAACKLAEHSNNLLIVVILSVVVLQTVQTTYFGVFLKTYPGPGLPYFEQLVPPSEFRILHNLIP